MMKKNLFSALFYSLLFVSLIFSCKPDDSDDSPKLSELDAHINDFIWQGLNECYLWVDNVPELAYSSYPSEESYNDFINSTADHEEFFYDLLYSYKIVDKFSWIVDDYEELEQMFQGITKSMGFEFRLGRITGTNNLFGIVIYVLPNTPASKAGMKRGDIFVRVDNQDITEANYNNLLFESENYTLTLASIVNNNLVLTDETVNLTAVEIHENPIYIDTVYNVGGKKVGYLMYNGFMTDYDQELNSVFKNFKSQNIDDLILDLRYNGGGYGISATNMASMIYTTDTNKIFYKDVYNTRFQKEIDDAYGVDFSINKFTDKLITVDSTTNETITSLGLSRLFIITTNNTASASELIINGLKPYMDVVTIGTATYGKYVGSFTIKDWDRKGNVNPDHKWAMQPIVLKEENSIGESDFVNGFPATDQISEDISNLSTLGNTNEPLLSRAIGHITGTIKSADLQPSDKFLFVNYGFSKDRFRFSKELLINNKFKQGIFLPLNN